MKLNNIKQPIESLIGTNQRTKWFCVPSIFVNKEITSVGSINQGERPK